MEMLYGRKRTRTDTYRYQVNQGGDLAVYIGAHENNVEIVFEDGKYSRCTFHFRGPYTRSHWHVLRGIAEEITRLETEYRNESDNRKMKACSSATAG